LRTRIARLERQVDVKRIGVAWLNPDKSIVFVPEEKELDQVIAACSSRRMSTFLQCLK